MNGRVTTWDSATCNPAWFAAGLLLRPLHLCLAFPSVLYLAALTVFLFRPPDLYLYYADRIAFCVLVFFVLLHALAVHEKIPFLARFSLPMLGLSTLAVFRALREPFDVQTWSLVASKFIVPFVLFHVAVLVFHNPSAHRLFQIFVILALAYLVFTAVAFLVDARSLVFPRFILDQGLGIHADRARGPFLQAVANGVSLIMLGILAVVLSPRRSKVVLLLWIFLPLAVLATMTRAVWISFAVSTCVIGFRLAERRLCGACAGIAFAALLIGLATILSDSPLKNALWERTAERGPVDVRMAVYDAGWAMFQERPVAGWTAARMYAELARRMEGYHLRTFYIHNTYLSLLLEFGIPGLLLYGILFVNLFRLARADCGDGAGQHGSVSALRKVWPVLLGVYLFNAFFVDMAYQFVIGLMFTVAGILCSAQDAAS
jgi:O-antigen ligase